MESKVKILNAVKIAGGTVLSLGIIMVLIGFFESDYNILISLGIGTVIGAVFIFLMGLFFVVTEEMHEKSFKGINVPPMETK